MSPNRKPGTGSGASKKRKKDTGEAGNGGQFGHTTRAEPDVDISLSSADPAEELYQVIGYATNEKVRDSYDAGAYLTREEVEASDDYFAEEHLLDRIRHVSDIQCRRRGVNEHMEQEVVSDSVEELLRRMRKGENDTEKNPFGHRSAITSTYINRVVSGQISHRLANGDPVHSTTRSAQAELRRRKDRIAAERGFPVSGREEERMAEELRQELPENKRPARGFQNIGKGKSLDQPIGEDGSMTFGDTLHDDEYDLDPVGNQVASDPDQEAYDEAKNLGLMDAAEVMSHVDDEDDKTIIPSRMKSAFYNVLSQTMRIPVAHSNVIGHRKALQLRKIVKSDPDDQGVREACRAYLDGETDGTDERSRALFSPFGDIDDEKRYSLCENLTKMQCCEEMWVSAMCIADRGRTDISDTLASAR